MKFVILGIIITTCFLAGCIDNCNCDTDKMDFTKTGVVRSIENFVSFDMIIFEDDSILKLHGSPDAEYDLFTMEQLLLPGVNYTFSYHHECVWSDGNDPHCFEGNVIDRIEKHLT